MEIKSKIPIEVLCAVKTIVTHAHCPDGLASAILLHDVLPKAEILFLTHDQLLTLKATEGMLFCDIAPPVANAFDFLAKGALVLDHHKSARSVVERFVDIWQGVFADEGTEPGVSGAVLAFRHVWKPLKRAFDVVQYERQEPEADYLATLVSVRDTFQKTSEHWKDSWDLSAALMFRAAEEWLAEEYPFRPGFWYKAQDLGEIVNANNRRRAERALTEGFGWITPKGRSVLITQGLDLTTLLGEMVAATGKFDLVIGFQYRTDPATAEPRFQVSMRSQGVVDVSVIAKLHGGGGHTNAAGFTLKELPDENPIDWIWIRLLKEV